MGIFDRYKTFHSAGVKFIPFQAHTGMAFFFTVLFWNYAVYQVPAMIAVIAFKEYMDSRSDKLPYSWFDLGSWAFGALMAGFVIYFRG